MIVVKVWRNLVHTKNKVSFTSVSCIQISFLPLSFFLFLLFPLLLFVMNAYTHLPSPKNIAEYISEIVVLE